MVNPTLPAQISMSALMRPSRNTALDVARVCLKVLCIADAVCRFAAQAGDVDHADDVDASHTMRALFLSEHTMSAALRAQTTYPLTASSLA